MKPEKTPPTDSAEQIVMLDPAKVRAESNIRYALTKSDIAQMSAAIVDQGRITTPVEVDVLDPPVNGFEYDLTAGFRRHASALELNKTGAGLLLPAIVRPLGGDKLTRLKHQLSENLDRKNLSPMDEAVACKALIEAGMPGVQVREMFKRPGKGTSLEAASPAWLKMRLSFLGLDKDTRTKIHTGVVGVAAAYELTKVSPEKRVEVLENAEKARAKELQKEQTESEKIVKVEAKAKELAEAREVAFKAFDETTAEVEIARVNVANLGEANIIAYKKVQTAPKGGALKKAKEAHSASSADLKGAQNKLAGLIKDLDKVTKAKQKIEEDEAAASEAVALAKAAPARKGSQGRSKGAAVGPQDVQRAARDAGENTGAVKLNVGQIRKLVEEMSLLQSYEKIAAIGAALQSCFNGETSKGQLLKALALISGDTKKVAPAKR